MSSLRATAAPLWESDVGGTALLASLRQDFAGSRHDFAAWRSKIRPQSSQDHPKSLFEAPFDEFSETEASKSEPRAPKGGPEDAKERPRARQESPKGCPGAPKTSPRGPRSVQKWPKRDEQGVTRGLRKRSSAENAKTLKFDDLTTFFNDFGGAGGHVLEPMSLRNRWGKRSFRSFGQRKRASAVQERPRAAQEPTKSAQERAKRATWAPKAKTILWMLKEIPRTREVGGLAEAAGRGGEVNLPSSEGVRRLRGVVSNASLPA